MVCEQCEPFELCIQTKAVKVPHPRNDDKTNVLLGLLSFDMTGPIQSSIDWDVYLIALLTLLVLLLEEPVLSRNKMRFS